ncbi:MAG: DUF4351 domain-containing protein, partial [Clostridium sp.]|nr:DUF4351 domain-containing protein [Clostridium sp.]
KDVTTYVVYSGNIKNAKDTLETGINKYKVKSIFMSDKNGDLIVEELEQKVKNKENITKQELVALTFTPIMGGKLTKAEKIIKSIRIVKSSNNEYKYDIESMLYAFADKFLRGKDLQRVKEEISMTELGRMLIEDGIEKGIEKGRAEGKTETLIKLLIKKFGFLSEEYKNKISKLSNETIDIILMEIFDIKSINELDKYFSK